MSFQIEIFDSIFFWYLKTIVKHFWIGTMALNYEAIMEVPRVSKCPFLLIMVLQLFLVRISCSI